MTAYYNENNPFCAAWLENLIQADCIAPGVVDSRSILEITPHDLKGFSQCHFFAGIGVWSYALREAEWSDERHIWTGSCPCQPFSNAGSRLAFGDDRDLWPIWYELIRECNPSIVVGEQVASKDGIIWLDILSAEMEEQNFTVGAATLPAAGFGAPHIRERNFWVAYAERNKRSRPNQYNWNPVRVGRFEKSIPWNEPWPTALAKFRAMDDGIARNVAVTDAYRNAIVGPVAAEFCSVVKEIADNYYLIDNPSDFC